ncbi:MAG: glycosyltransferase family 4 protein [Candidatus Pacebacteria bacterium]|nr:glycosyltransferase family 4 protein [Candidatus Paceibacterota bacterium]
MKVGLISSHSFVNPGGVKNHIIELYNHLKKRGIECKIIIPRRNKREDYGEDIIFLGRSWQLNTAGTQGDFCLVSKSKVKTVFEREEFDVLHFHNFILPYSSIMLGCSKSTNIVTIHANLEAMPIVRSMPFLVDGLAARYMPKIDGILGVADFNLHAFKDFELPKEVIPNGIDLYKFNPGNQGIPSFDDGKVNILFIGRIEERKGLIYLLIAYKALKEKYPNIRLIIVGEGVLENECKDYCKHNSLEDVVFEGTKEDVRSYYASCDIFCSPAIYGESFGIVLLEAMASGKPVVCFGNMGYRRVLEGTEGEGFMAPPRDQDGLISKLALLIEDAELRERMGNWGLEEAKKYSWDSVVDRIIAFYDKCSD